MQLTSEQIQAALSCATPEELVQMAADNGITISLEQAQSFLNPDAMVEIDEDDIPEISGGCSDTGPTYHCDRCGFHYANYPYYKLRTASTGIVQSICQGCHAAMYDEEKVKSGEHAWITVILV